MKFLRNFLKGALYTVGGILVCVIMTAILFVVGHVLGFLLMFLLDCLFNPTLKGMLIIAGVISLGGGLVFALSEVGVTARPKDAIAEEYKEED